jgi:lysophospholipase L1-like esterase
MGFTGDVVDSATPPDAWRVLVLGSSTMFNRHMADQLKAALQQRTQRRVVLVDAGLRSHTTRANLIKLQYLLRHRWDHVLVYDGINDLWANHVLPEDFRSDYGHLDPWYVRNAVLDHSLLARYSFDAGYRWLQGVRRFVSASRFPDYQFVFPKKPYINAADFAALHSFSDNLASIVRLVRAHGAEPVLMTFAYHLPVDYSRQAFLDGRLDYHNPDGYDPRDVYNWGPPHYVREGLTQQIIVCVNWRASNR